MAIEGNLRTIPGLKAGSDLSTKNFRIVKLTGDFTADVCSAVTDKPCGIVQNAPKSGAEASVAYTGISKVVLGGTVSAGDYVGPDANGAAIVETIGTDTTHYVVGQMLEAGVSGDVRSVLLHGGAAGRAS